jgi:endonuclease/exonuclease/phosphatase family metal-dependent hydrolase
MFHGKISADIARGLKALRSRIDAAKIPSSKIDETLNIATWNIRELGKSPRSEAALHYIAEIIGQFDLVSIVELRDDLTDLGRVLKILGPYWHAVYSDMIPDAGGNHERLGFVYDKRAVAFTGLAAAANPPRRKVGTEFVPEFTWWRTPYMASFASGNFDFVVLTTHVRWGSGVAERSTELASLAKWIDLKRQQKTLEDKDMIVMGDFNIPSRRSSLFKTLTAKHLALPGALATLEFGTDLAKGKRYDQIFHYPIYPENFTNAGGVLDFYAGDHRPLFPALAKEKFTYQVSDHLPLWIQINTDIDGQVLDQIIRARGAR